MSMKIGDIAFRMVGSLNLPTLVNSLIDERTIVVPDYAPALKVIEAAEPKDLSLIVCMSEQGVISGVVVPSHVNDVIAKMYQRPVTSLAATIDFMLDNAQERARNFHHERINTRVVMFECPNGPHYTDGDPCPEHHIPTTPSTF
jgi:hypothetical protein